MIQRARQPSLRTVVLWFDHKARAWRRTVYCDGREQKIYEDEISQTADSDRGDTIPGRCARPAVAGSLLSRHVLP